MSMVSVEQSLQNSVQELKFMRNSLKYHRNINHEKCETQIFLKFNSATRYDIKINLLQTYKSHKRPFTVANIDKTYILQQLVLIKVNVHRETIGRTRRRGYFKTITFCNRCALDAKSLRANKCLKTFRHRQ